MNRLAGAMAQKATEKLTENGDKTYSTSKSACLDLFALGGSLRTRSESDILALWRLAEEEDPVTAYKILFLIRSVRNGYGERRTFRVVWNSLYHDVQSALVHLVPEVGRFDDLEDSIMLNSQIAMWVRENLDYEYGTLDDGQSPSLLAKWLPCGRGNESAKERTRRMAKRLGYSEQEYRKKVTAIRKKLDLVESKMVNKEWSKIDYSKLPSLAGHKYTKAFARHDNERYSEFLDKVRKGEVKINAEVITPTEVLAGGCRGDWKRAEAEWVCLPDFLGDNNSGIAIVDTSGSMTWGNIGGGASPLDAAVAMGIYFAEHNKGPFKDLFMTFESSPSFVDLSKHKSLRTKDEAARKASWGGSTNLRRAFESLLDLAKRTKCSPEDMPKSIYIFSDMEFNAGVEDFDETTYESVKRIFKEEGYDLPRIVFWNLNTRNNTLPVQKDEIGTVLVSGYSARTFKTIVKGTTPEEAMMEALEAFPYSREIEITISQLIK